MQIAGLTAEPDAGGGKILLSWTNPPDATFSSIKILRRESTLPLVPEDFGSSYEVFNDLAPQKGAPESYVDSGPPGSSLRGETTYYYAVVAIDSTSNPFPSFISAMATAPYQTGAYLYGNLPGIYQTYDTTLPTVGATADPADQNKGQLLRFLEMFGLQFDVLRSFSGGARNFFDVDKIDGNLLPLLAQWIGWQSDFTLPFSKQRNEISYAPSFYRTTGVPANLRAMVNRVSTWDAHIKEFAHNIFRSSEPEQLALYTMRRKAAVWQPEELVTLDIGHEGKASVLLARDGLRIFYHTRQDVPFGKINPRPRWQILYKNHNPDGWLPAHALTSGDSINRYPAAIARSDGTTWLFWADYEPLIGRLTPKLSLQVLMTGRGALRARVQGSSPGPFALVDGDQFQLVITSGGPSFTRTVTARAEDFANMAQATGEEVVALFNRELPFVDASLTVDNFIALESQASGSTTSLQVLPSILATKLGFTAPTTVTGTDAQPATLSGSLAEPFALSSGDQLSFLRDGDVVRTVQFESTSFLNIGAATAQEVVSVINAVAPGAASAVGGHVVLQSRDSGEPALVSVNVSASIAAQKLGFGTAPPALPLPNSEPFALSATDQLVVYGKADAGTTVVFQAGAFVNIAAATAAEVVAAINAVIPGASIAVSGQVLLNPFTIVNASASTAAPKLGLGGSSSSSSVKTEPFDLSAGDTLAISGNEAFSSIVGFNSSEFANMGAATAAEVAGAMSAVVPGLASAAAGKVVLTPLVVADATVGGVVTTLGLGTADETQPAVFEDASKDLWLFWSSRRSGQWNIWYDRFDGTAWGTPKQLTTGTQPDCEPAVLFDAASTRIWVFWSRKKTNGLWNIFYRSTTKTDFTTLTNADWTPEVELTPVPPNPPGSYDNREPAPILLGADSLELFFSSDRDNGWNTWSKPLSSGGQGADAQVTSGQFSRRSPAPLLTNPNEVTIWFRSNKTQTYTSKLYPSAETVDARYAGSLTADTRNPARLSLRKNIQDIQRYTYHTPSQDPTLTPGELAALEEKRLYSRDTVGVYLVPDTNDQQLIIRNQALIQQTLPQFLPIQVRAVFLLDQAFSELIYDYAGNGAAAPLIGEQMTDVILGEGLGAITDEYSDTAGFKFVRTWLSGMATGGLPDLTVHPPDLSFRLPVKGLQEGA